jgi:hypothetical protein
MRGIVRLVDLVLSYRRWSPQSNHSCETQYFSIGAFTRIVVTTTTTTTTIIIIIIVWGSC